MKLCKSCKAPIKNNGSYCNNECQMTLVYTNYIAKWKANKVSGLRGNSGQLSMHIYRYIRTKFGNECCLCGWNKINPTTGKTPVTVDHIDGDYKNCQEDNLRLLCPSCHSLTPTYGSLNIGFGRPR